MTTKVQRKQTPLDIANWPEIDRNQPTFAPNLSKTNILPKPTLKRTQHSPTI